MDTFNSAFDHPIFNKALNMLIEHRFYADIHYGNQIASIDTEDIKQAVWLASILADSPLENHKQQAANFAKLLFLYNRNETNIAKASYIILSRTGNLLATNFLTSIYERDELNNPALKKFISSFGTLLDLEIGSKRTRNQIEVGQTKYLTTDFQQKLWKTLKIKNHICISAPTSAGKSFFIEKYIVEQFRQNASYNALYIVPTRALITQVTDSFRNSLQNDVYLRTAFIEDEQNRERPSKEMYVITPERCLKFLQQGAQKKFYPNIVFIDEIQNIENDDNRGVLFEYVITEISKIWPNSKLIFAGPFIDKSNNLYNRLTTFNSEEVSTLLSPVFQLKLIVKPINDSVSVKITIKDKNLTKENIVETGFDLSNFTRIGDALVHVVNHFGSESQNIIYVPKTNLCESYAFKLAKIKMGTNNFELPLDEDLQDLIDFLRDEIHPYYSLIKCLKKEIAFHHGKLPEIVRSEIESLFKNKKIQNLFCTSTLLQGVNLPAEKIFIPTPKRDNNELSPFEFGNLIGRAGRISESLYGSIYCLESNNEEWAERYLTTEYNKELYTTVEKALESSMDKIFETLNQNPSLNKYDSIEYTSVFLKQKFLKNKEEYLSYLKSKNVSDVNIDILSKTLEEKFSNLKIPVDILKLNPTIDPILQDTLYNRILKDGINQWVIINDQAINPNFLNPYLTRAQLNSLPYYQKNLFGQLEVLFAKLNETFFMWKETSILMGRSGSITYSQMAFYAIAWLQGSSYKQLIDDYIKYYSSEKIEPNRRIDPKKTEDVDRAINRVININHVIITYILVKYTKLLKDILEFVLETPEAKEKFRFTLSLPTMLELGTSNITELILISNGLPRPIAINISKIIPQEFKEKPIEWLKSAKNLNLRRIYLKYLKQRGFINVQE